MANVETMTYSKADEVVDAKRICKQLLETAISEQREMSQVEQQKYDYYQKIIKENEKGNGKMKNDLNLRNAKNGEDLAELEIRQHHMGYNPATEGGANFKDAKVSTMAQTVLDLLHENAVVLEHVMMEQVQGERKLPVAVNDNKKTAIVLENEAFTEKDYGVRFVNLECQKLGQMSVVSAEALQDSQVNIPMLIANQTAKDYARKIEELILVGATPHKAEGVLVAEGVQKVEVDAFGYDALVEALYALPKMARAKAVFVTDKKTIMALRKMVDGNGRPLMEASTNSIGQRGVDLVLGCPCVEVEATNLPAGVFGAFVDFDDALFVGVGRQFTMVRDDSMRRNYDQTVFVSSMRFGCVVKDAQCVAVIKQRG